MLKRDEMIKGIIMLVTTGKSQIIADVNDDLGDAADLHSIIISLYCCAL